jgi:hypothetical protein
MESWIIQAKYLSSLEAEICFLLRNDFYYGLDSHPEVVERKEIEVLSHPSFFRKVDLLARTTEVTGNESELVEYYEQVINYAKKHKKTFRECQSYFWLRLWLWNEDANIIVSFPWSDTQSDFDRFIEGLISVESGLAYSDRDQGWEIEFIAQGDFLYIRESDPDSDEIYYQIKVLRNSLITQLINAQNRSKSIISYLSIQIGADLWTKYSSYSPLEFPISKLETEKVKPWWKI